MRMIKLAWLAGLSCVASVAAAQARDVDAGPIWNQSDAQEKCPRVCQPPASWNGQWRTTVPGRSSVCGCESPIIVVTPTPPPTYAPVPPRMVPPPPPQAAAREVNAGPIWTQADAQQTCPTVCRAPERWTGGWRTTVPGRMSVFSCA